MSVKDPSTTAVVTDESWIDADVIKKVVISSGSATTTVPTGTPVTSTAAATAVPSAPPAPHMSSVMRNRLKDALRAKFDNPARTLDTPKEVEKAKVEEKKVELVEGQVLASTLLGFAVKPDFAVDVLKNSDIPAEIRMFIPAAMPNYHVQQVESVQILRAMQNGDKILITGPTGSGKSSLVEYLCHVTNRPMIRLNMNGDVESANIFGQLTAKDGATVWVDGAATEAVRYGAVLVNDEWDVTPPEIMFGYQWLMEDNGKLFLKEMPASAGEKMLVPHKNFRFVCLGNTLGQGDDTGRFAGTNVQNTATIDRFQTTISLGYLQQEHEVAVIKKAVPELSDAQVNDMMKVTNLVRQGNSEGQVSLSISPRTLINWGRKMIQWNNPKVAFELAFINKLTELERGAVLAMFTKVFGSRGW